MVFGVLTEYTALFSHVLCCKIINSDRDIYVVLGYKHQPGVALDMLSHACIRSNDKSLKKVDMVYVNTYNL